MKTSSLSLASLPMAAAFAPHVKDGSVQKKAAHAEAAATSLLSLDRPIFDPLGLYPENSPERVSGLIQPLERSTGQKNKEVFDPLGLYMDQSQVSADLEMSPALPFLPRPSLLDGTLPGDRGFDPFNFASDASALQWQRRAEVKHARLAMLAAAGWPLAELFHKGIASALDLPASLAGADRVPSVLNDGLSHAAFPTFWIAAIAGAACIEIGETVEDNMSCKLDPADMSFDPLGFGGKTEREKHYMREAEIFNGRLGMLAVTGFAIQEWCLNSAVVDQVPFFFKPLNIALGQLMN